MNNETHETHEDRVKILEGAPDVNAELYIDGAGKYVSISTEGRFTYKKLDSGYNIQYGSSLVGLRSLSDIQQLVDMQNEIDALKIEKSKLSHRIYEHNCRIIGAPRE